MKIAVMSDIHANINALEAVLADATEKGAEEFWNLGNSVSFGAFHEEVVSLLDGEPIYSTVGSYDLMVMESSSKAKKFKKKDVEKGRKQSFTRRHLSGSEKRFLEAMTDRKNIVVESRRLLAVHGSMEPLFISINKNTSCEELSEIFQALKKDGIFCWVPGEPFIKECEGRLFINPGSVGFPDDGDSRASYSIVEINEDGFTASLHRVGYDIEAAVVQAAERGLPEIYTELLFSGRRKASGIKKAVHDDYIMAARSLAVRNLWDDQHSIQVLKNSEHIFEGLAELHGFGEKELIILQSACILHDIGLNSGVKAHHKKTMKIILKSTLRPFSEIEKNMVALVARYHRKSLPSKKHDIYSSLEKQEKHIVDVLSSIIRVADGLDRTHQNMVEKIACNGYPSTIELICRFKGEASSELEYGLKKSDLMKIVFGREILIKPEAIESPENAETNQGDSSEY